MSLLATLAFASACGGELAAEPNESGAAALAPHDRADDVVYLDQGWDDATRAAFYTTTQGSRLLPAEWFLSLEQAQSRDLFASAENLRGMGYLVDVASTNPGRGNQEGVLPVGFAIDVDAERGEFVGFTCSACHTGQLEFQGKRVRIDGGQSFGDIERLQQEMLASLEATLADSQKFKRFAKEVLGPSARKAGEDELRAKLETTRAYWVKRVARSRGQTPHGPTRTDAFTIIGNEIVCDLFNEPSNCAPANAPTQFPPLWGTPDLEWVQYNSSVHSPLGRNVGQVTGVFAENGLDAAGVKSTANLPNLHKLENLIKSLRAPSWPEDILGSIDRDLAAQGAGIYAAKCASCHESTRSAPNRFGKTFATVNFDTPLSVLGTDRTAALSFATRRALPGPFAPVAQMQGLIGADGKAPVAALLAISGTMIIQRFFATPPALTDLEKADYLDFRESRTATTAQLTTYKARKLNGVALTAPYLHNGSVPSLYELLLPPAERSRQFYVGSKEFDPQHLGFESHDGEGMLFDTSAIGNGNGGHVYGTDLADDQRLALLEYLKTL